MRATLILVLGLAMLPAGTAQRDQGVVGRYRLKPGLVHPLILSELPRGTRAMNGPDLSLHPTVPFRATLTPGRRPGEYGIKSEPDVRKNKFIVPGLLDVPLRYGKGRQRDHRWEISEVGTTLHLQSQSGAWVRIQRYEVFFLDLNHDGAFGGPSDGYVMKSPKEKQWVKTGQPIDFRPLHLPAVIRGERVWFEVEPEGFSVTVTDVAPDLAAGADAGLREALEYLNAIRARLRFDPVVLDPELAAACALHARYCAKHGETREEIEAAPEFTPEGARAGLGGVTTKAASAREAIDLWLSTFYRRVDMLRPDVRSVGLAFADGIAVMDFERIDQGHRFDPFTWPLEDAVDVPVSWLVGDDPSPLPGEVFDAARAKTFGPPITVTFSTWRVSDVKAGLIRDGVELDCLIATPREPANKEGSARNENSILVMSRAPLEPGTTYTMHVSCTFGGEPFDRTWRFTTRAE